MCRGIFITFVYFEVNFMQKIVSVGWLFFIFLQTTLLANTDLKYERYTILSEKYFDKQEFDSCLHYHYILAHYYSNNHDTINLVNTWYNIAIVNLLQEKHAQAQAARIIAHQYITSNNTSYRRLDNVYYSIREFKTHNTKSMYDLSGFRNLTGHACIFFRRLCYIQPLLKGEYDYRNKDLTSAKIILHKLLRELKEKGDVNWFGYARANMLMGDCFYEKNEYFNSIFYYETAIRIYEINQIYNTDWMNTYRRFLDALWYTGQSEKRDSCFQRIEKGDFIKKTRAGYYFIKGDYLKYTSKQETSDAYLQAYYSSNFDTKTKNDLTERIIYQYVNSGQYDKAKVWMKKFDDNHADDYDKLVFAYCCAKLGDTIRGNNLIKSLEIKKLWFYKDMVFWVGQYFFEAKNYKKAELYYTLCERYLLKNKSHNYYFNMNTFSRLGYFYWFGKANYRRSLEYYHKAVCQLVNEQVPDDLYQIPDINKSISDLEYSRELSNKAQAFYEVSKLQKTKAGKLRDLKASLANLEASLAVAYRYKMSLSRDEQRYEYADNIKYRYPYVINVCIELYRETGDIQYAHKAFEYAEKSKASLLLSTMRGVNASKMHLLPEDLKIKEDQLWRKGELLSRYLSESYQSPEKNRGRIDQYNISLNILRHQQDSLIQVFKTKYPAYYNARYNQEVISADSLQKLLSPREAVLEYTLSSDKLVIFVLTRNEFKIITDTLGRQFFIDAETYRKTLSNYNYDDNNVSVRRFDRCAYDLYKRLIKPAEPFINNKKIIIIPDDVLNQISFETFVTKPLLANEKNLYKKLSYLIKKYAFSYCYSGTLYSINYQTHTYNNAKLLAIAPYYDRIKLKQLIIKDLPSTQRDSVEIFPLPGIYDEVKSIHRLFGGKLLVKRRATEENFKNLASEYEILHLATHGTTNDQFPMFSKLVFTLGKDSVNDGLLNTYEIYNMKINAPLVVLSACNTGYGKLHKGEGVISLSRAFFTSGAKTVVMTLYPIPDGNSSEIMTYFYENLAASQNIGDALYHAKLKYLEKSNLMDAHPSLWAGYVVLGNSSNNFKPYPPKNWYFWWIGSLLVVVILLIARKKIKFHLISLIERT